MYLHKTLKMQRNNNNSRYRSHRSTELRTKRKNVSTGVGFEHDIIIPGEIRDAVQQFTNNTQFSQRLSELAQQSGLNTTRLESASPDGDIMARLQNFTEFVEARRAGSNMTSSE